MNSGCNATPRASRPRSYNGIWPFAHAAASFTQTGIIVVKWSLKIDWYCTADGHGDVSSIGSIFGMHAELVEKNGNGGSVRLRGRLTYSISVNGCINSSARREAKRSAMDGSLSAKCRSWPTRWTLCINCVAALDESVSLWRRGIIKFLSSSSLLVSFEADGNIVWCSEMDCDRNHMWIE